MIFRYRIVLACIYLCCYASPLAAQGTPALTSLTLNPPRATGGSQVTGTVTLGSPAGSFGNVVTLTSSNTAVVTVPSFVYLPAGTSSGSFPVTTQPVLAETVVTISATLGVTRTATLTVVPSGSAPSAPQLGVEVGAQVTGQT